MPPSPEKHAFTRLGLSAAVLGGSLLVGAYHNQYQDTPSVELRMTPYEASMSSVMYAGSTAMAGTCKVEITLEGVTTCPELPATTSNMISEATPDTTIVELPPTTTTTEQAQEVAARQPKPRASRNESTPNPLPEAQQAPLEDSPPAGEVQSPPEEQLPEEPAAENEQNEMAGTKYDWMNRAGIAQNDQGYVDAIMIPESKWNPAIVSANNCIGLGQNCPYKGTYWLKQACPKWAEQPICQLRRFTVYAVDRYGSWKKAYEFRRAKGYW